MNCDCQCAGESKAGDDGRPEGNCEAVSYLDSSYEIIYVYSVSEIFNWIMKLW